MKFLGLFCRCGADWSGELAEHLHETTTKLWNATHNKPGCGPCDQQTAAFVRLQKAKQKLASLTSGDPQ